jgi:hypothetical protein
MPGSVTSVLSEAEDFAAALREEGVLGLLVTAAGEFRARLTQVTLHHLRLSAGEERLSRIAFVAVPAKMILVALTRRSGPGPIWGGVRLRADEIMTLGAGERLHMRTDGPCRWGSIWLPAAELHRYGSALTGADFALPAAARLWRLRPAMSRHLRHFHSAGIEAIERRSNAFIGGETAHGLEQQLIEALVECLSNASVIEMGPAICEYRDVVLRLEALLQAQSELGLRIAGVHTTLGVLARDLRLACEEQLGIGPAAYVRRRQMQQVHRS